MTRKSTWRFVNRQLQTAFHAGFTNSMASAPAARAVSAALYGSARLFIFDDTSDRKDCGACHNG